MRDNTPGAIFTDILQNNMPEAVAWINGNWDNPQLSGLVKFYKTPYEGILIEGEVFGLPNIAMPGETNFYAMHIHEYGDCTKPFDKTGNHYTRDGELHPQHSGDMIPLL